VCISQAPAAEAAGASEAVVAEDYDLYTEYKKLQRQLEFLQVSRRRSFVESRFVEAHM
jgi:hypothetical protein